MTRYIQFLAIFFLSLIPHMQVHALSDDSEEMESGAIVVRLATENRLLPVYLESFKVEGRQYGDIYAQKLEEILRFDLSHNGMTEVLPVSASREGRLRRLAINEPVVRQDWEADKVFYVIRVRLTDQGLKATLCSVNSGSVKGVNDVSLTGDLNQDRRKVHELADLFHETLFQRPGIASTRVLYTVRHANADAKGPRWLSEVWECDYDGHNAIQVTHDGSYCVTPSYLPPKSGFSSGSIFYVSYKTGQPKIKVASLRDGVGRKFSSLRGNQLMPIVNAKRDRVAFISDAAGNPDLFVQPFSPEIGALGKPFQVYANARSTQASPCFSPDGSRIAFVSNKDGRPRIYTIDVPRPGENVKNLQLRLITKVNRENTAPSWSPDGTKLAYSARSGGTRQIWVYDFATGKERQITQGRGHKENPTWAPNSLHLVFNSAEPGVSELYLVNLNQPEAVKISSGAGEKRFPNWEPRP